MNHNLNKIVLAYSGGLDTSVILRWLQDTYDCEVVTFTADLGQGEELEPARVKAEAMGVKEIYIEDLREEFAADFVFPHVPGQRRLRGGIPAGHLHRPAPHRQAPGGDRRRNPGRRRLPRRHRQGQRPSPLRAGCLRPQPRHLGGGPLAHLGPGLPREAGGLCRRARHPHRSRAGGRLAVLHGRQPAPHLLRGRSAGGPVDRAPRRDVALVRRSPQRPRHPDRNRAHLPGRQHHRHKRPAPQPGHRARRVEPHRRGQRHRPARLGGEPLRGHEVAGLLRNPRRHHHAQGPPGHGKPHPRPGGGPPQRRAHAPLRPADLQRLLVESRAPDAPDRHRPLPAAGEPAPCGSSSTGAT